MSLPAQSLVAPGIWPRLCRQMRADSASWDRLAPAQTRLVVLSLPVLAELVALPDLVDCLQAEQILNCAEGARLRSLALAKRRTEWLGGRCAAKFALMQLCGQPEVAPACFAIANEDCGRPFVQASLAPLPRLSLSHSGGLAVALAAQGPCGLDVQEACPTLARVQERFASPAEQALGGSCALLRWLALIWAAKEAVKKCCYADQPTFMERIRVIALDSDPATEQPLILWCSLEDRPEPLGVRAAFADGHALALVCL